MPRGKAAVLLQRVRVSLSVFVFSDRGLQENEERHEGDQEADEDERGHLER